ncbi:heterokaryon incompatibility protein-domain-containing protein, partial [Bisporella sp. PMI_857]
MSAYTYFPLASTRHTRILQLDAAQDPSEDLKCRLVQINIDTDDASYEAVSYAWGQADFCCHILVGGKEKLRITRSLKDALCRFRLASEVRRLWVDAICINQSDDFEKSTHIPLMSTIYQGALRVLAWLGDNQDDV